MKSSRNPSSGEVVAAVDAGSHTTRLLIARVGEGGVLSPLVKDRRVTALARGFQEGGPLPREGAEATLRALCDYAARIREAGAARVVFGATGVFRRSADGEAHLSRIREETGLPAHLVSEGEEARHAARGVLSSLPQAPGVTLLFDLGGGSTEFVLVEGGAARLAVSVPIGAATVTEDLLSGEGPQPPEALDEAGAHVLLALARTLAKVAAFCSTRGGPFRVIGTAGTVTTLAAMRLGLAAYDEALVHGHEIPEAWVSETVSRLAETPLSERRGIPGLEPGREAVILGGGLIVRQILRGLAAPALTVSDAGFLEGLLLQAAEDSLGLPHPLFSPLTWRRHSG